MHQTNNYIFYSTFSEFFHENQEKFLSFAYSYIRDRQEAEDILMESMITCGKTGISGKKIPICTVCC